MCKVFQVVLDGKVTMFAYGNELECMHKMRELMKEFPKSIVTFIEIDL